MEKDILNSIKEKGAGFSIPENYFDQIEAKVENVIQVSTFPVEEGFVTPESYFNTVENSVIQTIKQQSVPHGYFDTIEDNVFDKIKKGNKPEVINLKTRIKKVFIPLSIAASLLLIFILNYKSDDLVPKAASLTEVEIQTLIDEDFIILNSYEIAEVYNDTELDVSTINEDIELSEYLNGIDVESLILEN